MSNLSGYFRHALFLALSLSVIGLVGCNRPTSMDATAATHPDTSKEQASVAPPAALPADASQGNDLANFAKALRVQCEDASKGRGCTAGNMEAGDFYDIELSPNCSAEGFFAGVSEPDAPLLDTLPVTGSKAQINARLSDGQFVCVQATARAGQQPAYYYVVGLPVASIPACRGKPICNQHGDRPITFVAQHKSGKACALIDGTRPEGDCAQGWIEPQKLDVFSNGI